MPYVITTRPPSESKRDPNVRPGSLRDFIYPPSHRAVATLDEAREAICAMVPVPVHQGQIDPAFDAGRNLSEQGGTVALPDGTVIEVERVDWDTFRDLMGGGPQSGGIDHWKAEAIAAYNLRDVGDPFTQPTAAKGSRNKGD